MIDRFVTVLFVALGAALLVPFLWVEALHHPGFIWLLAGYGVGYYLGCCVHELGHFVCGRAASIQIQHVWLGRGPLLFYHRFGETTFELRLNLRAGGAAVPFRPLRYNRYAWMFFTLGGAIANATLLALLLLAFKIPWSGNIVADPRWGLAGAAAAQVMLIVRNLRPHSWVHDGRAINSDGAILWSLMREKNKDAMEQGAYFVGMLRRYASGAEPEFTASLAAERIFSHIVRVDRSTDERVRREVDDALLRELKRGGLSKEEELLTLDALMTDAVLYEDPALLAQIDAWSLRALALGPEVKTLHGTRGAALVALKCYDEAKILLTPLTGEDADAFDRLLSKTFLARAEHGLGNTAAARTLIAQAQTICDSGPPRPAAAALVARVAKEVDLDTTTPTTS
jgi:peptidase M50-like protein